VGAHHRPRWGLTRINPAAVRLGALADLAILSALIAVFVIARWVGAAGFGTVVIVLASLLPPVAGGFVAGRHQRSAPLTNGAAAAAAAMVAYVVFRVLDAAVRGTTLHPASVVIFAMLTVTLGLLGGFAGFRTTAP